jgi:hypothetical protein
MANLNYSEDHARALLKSEFTTALFNRKLDHIDSHRYGLNAEKVLLKLCKLGPAMVAKLKEKEGYKVVVATLHFLHDDDEEEDGVDGLVEDPDKEGEEFEEDEGEGAPELGGDIDWKH